MDLKSRIQESMYSLYNQLRDLKWIIFFISFIIVFILGFWGFLIAFKNRPEQKTYLDLAYHTLQLYRTQSGAIVSVDSWQLEWARFLAPVLMISGILLILLIFFDYIKKFKLHFFTRGHVVVCGMGYVGPKIAEYFLQKRKTVVIIEKDDKNPELELFRHKGAVIYIGDATKRILLDKAQIHKARHIFAVTGNDALNSEIAVKCHEMTKGRIKHHLTCHVHIVDSYLCNLLRNQVRTAVSPDPNVQFRWEFFNIYQIAGHCIQKFCPLFPEISVPPDTNIMIIGIGRMGKTLVSRSARRWKELYGNTGKKITYSVLDRDAQAQIRLLQLQYPSITNYCEFKCVNLDLTSPDFIEGKYLNNLQNEKKISKIFICIDDSSVALSAALTLHRQIHDQNVCIIVRTIDIIGFATIFSALKATCVGLSNIFTFPIVSCDCCRDFIVMENRDILGKVIHTNYIAHKIKSGGDPVKDPAMKPWEELSESLKESNRQQADHLFEKIQKIGCFVSLASDWEEDLFDFTNEEIEFLAEVEHDRWMKDRLLDGWTYGDKRDIDQKKSPYLVPYGSLPEEIKDYDRESIRNIPMILSRIDMKIFRFPEICNRE